MIAKDSKGVWRITVDSKTINPVECMKLRVHLEVLKQEDAAARADADARAPHDSADKDSSDGAMQSRKRKMEDEGAKAVEDFMLMQKLAAATAGDQVQLALRQIRYSQESIRDHFRDGRAVGKMREELRTGRKDLANIPTIKVVLHDGVIYSTDNRRLWAFKHCDRSLSTRVEVIVGKQDVNFWPKFTTPSRGHSIRLRQLHGFGLSKLDVAAPQPVPAANSFTC